MIDRGRTMFSASPQGREQAEAPQAGATDSGLLLEQCIALPTSILRRWVSSPSTALQPFALTWTDHLLRPVLRVTASPARGGSGLAALGLAWTADDPTRRLQQTVRILETELHRGGRRRWFECPIGRACRAEQRRVGKLYQPPSLEGFGCRRCHGLEYASRRLGPGLAGLFGAVAARAGADVGDVRRGLLRAPRLVVSVAG